MPVLLSTYVISLNWYTILVWVVVGLVAGFLASLAAFGYGLGLVRDTLAGLAGAIIGGFLARYFHVGVVIVGHPIVSEIVVAFVGAMVLLLILRLVVRGGRRTRAV